MSVVTADSAVAEFMTPVIARNPGEEEFHQAVHEVAESLLPVIERHPEYKKERVLERLVEAERVIIFRVPWVDDEGVIQVNRGFRVEMNSAIGPYKGGLRFHPSVNLGILKFLAFEQVFKNALTTLPMGGGKGGSDFDPKGKSDREVMRFCQSFMAELFRHIGARTDVPAGDIGVGAREIGYLFGYYKKLRNEFTGVLTGKGVGWGGSLIRTEATGYGCVYFAEQMLRDRGESVRGKAAIVSGSGNVAQYTIEKLLHLGARPITVSDSDGFIVDREGIDEDKLEWIKALKNERRGRISEYADQFPHAQYHKGEDVWHIDGAQLAFPCATQNEISTRDAHALVDNRIRLVCEGANMPTEIGGIRHLLDNEVLFGPAKAANAGGVATSGLEMSQNASHYYWTREEVDAKLHAIMVNIHRTCVDTATEFGTPGNLVNGSNVAGFRIVANAMLAHGVV